MQTHNTETKARGARPARMNPSPVTPAEAKAVWHILAKPSTRKVADWFSAAGRPVRHKTIWKWQRAGWPGTSAADIAQAAEAALANIDRVAALSGDVGAAATDVGEPDAEAKAAQGRNEPPDDLSIMELAEESLRAVFISVRSVSRRIHNIATAVPCGCAAAGNARPDPLATPDGIAKMMMAASAAANTAIGGMRQLGALRADEAAAVPGTQTVYPPGEGPHANLPQADGSHGKRDYPSRAAIEAIEEALREHREAQRVSKPVPDPEQAELEHDPDKA
jgi:hypothetical protein